MSRVPRVVIVFTVEGTTTAHTEGVKSREDARRLQHELARRDTLDEIREALATLWNELSVQARGAS